MDDPLRQRCEQFRRDVESALWKPGAAIVPADVRRLLLETAVLLELISTRLDEHHGGS